ncbi:hypothetical protein [Neptuniibacter sp.]|uniref:hypothetical protein n=1 Tax=Neptuniibacter sp. TaxID=1962643 RepID=UPI003B58C030
MKLVKDLTGGRIVYYWVDGNDEVASDYLHSFVEAEEWWKHLMFSLYEGEDRRRSICDRRQDQETRKKLEYREKFHRSNPLGRRVTDMPVSIDIDLSKEKIKQLYIG